MSTHTALPADGVPAPKPLKPAAGTWCKHRGAWTVKVRATMHAPGRAARVQGQSKATLVTLGEVIATDREWVLSAFSDGSPKPPRQTAGAASDDRVALLRTTWQKRAAGGTFVAASRHILAEPDWPNLTAGETDWYLQALNGVN
ncbi:MAG: hypothetical protein WAV90_04515 [Gordonia amarae]